MVASDDIVQNLNHLNHGFALNPSPFVMKLGMEFIKDLKAGGLKDALTLVSSNRDYARQALQGTPLHICESLSEPSVLWLQLPANVAAGAFAAQCQQAGVSVMPGNHYFWANPREGDRFIRIACLRDAATFKAGIDLVAEIALIPGLPVDSRQRVANID
jgi:DNA-binding transcriptional MocR family regulator